MKPPFWMDVKVDREKRMTITVKRWALPFVALVALWRKVAA